MMKLKQIATIISLLIFLLLGWGMIFYPSIYSKKQSINGEVLIVWETAPPRPKWIVEVKEIESTKTINFQFIDKAITIHKGDSLRKQKGSDRFYIKRSNTSSWDFIDETGFVE